MKILNKNDVYILKGDIKFKVIDGVVELVGKKFIPNDEGFIPAGKSVPMEVIEDSKIEFSENKLNKIESRTIPAEWDELLNRIKREKDNRIIIFGEMDTGKSFFATYIANKLIESGRKIGIIDTDIGQSDIGPPTTLGLSLLEKPLLFLHNAKVHSMEFIGALSPSLHTIPMLVGFKRIVQKAIKLSDIVIINTNGWVHGDGARALKLAKIDIFEPDIIVLLQRAKECEPLVSSVLPKSRIVRFKVSEKVSDTSKLDREKLRNLVSQQYFENSKEIALKFNEFETERCYFKTGEKVLQIPHSLKDKIMYIEKYPAYEGTLVVSKNSLSRDDINILNSNGITNIRNIIQGNENGVIVGLLDETKEVLALGIIKEIDFRNEIIKILTPLNQDASKVKIIQFGSLKYTEDGKENGFVEPGYF